MAKIEKIQIGSSTYDLADSVARSGMIRRINANATGEIGPFEMWTRYSRFTIDISKLRDYGQYFFAIYGGKVVRTEYLNLWTQIRLQGIYRNSENNADDGTGFMQQITAVGECNGVNGPTDYSLTCYEALDRTKSKWTFYITAGLKYKIIRHYFTIYVFGIGAYTGLPSFSDAVPSMSGSWTSF